MTLLEARQSAENILEYFHRGDYPTVISLATPLIENTVDRPELRSIHIHVKTLLADAYRFQLRIDDAIALGMEILSLTENGDADENRAWALNTIGAAMLSARNPDSALEYLRRALELEITLERRERIAGVLCNIGNVYKNTKLDTALEYYMKALDALPNTLSTHFRGTIFTNIAYTYQALHDMEKSLEMAYRALDFYVEHGFDVYAIGAKHLIGILLWESSDFERAREIFLDCATQSRTFENKESLLSALVMAGHCECELNNLGIGEQYYNEALAISQEADYDSTIANILNGIGGIEFKRKNYEKAIEYYTQSVQNIESTGNTENPDGLYPITLQMIAKSNIELGNYSLARADIERALVSTASMNYPQVELTIRSILDEILIHENNYHEAYNNQQRIIEIRDTLQKEDVSREIEKREVERKIARQEKQLAIERARFQERENILNNILPEEITTRLINGENPIADYFECVSILFMDIVDFTTLSTKISAQQLVHLLNAIFSAADTVMREFGLEKIKTIGDAYMAVAGAPIVQEYHAVQAASAALKLLDVMKNLVVTFPEKLGDGRWTESLPEIEVRIGLHCGPVAAGVVGENKFLYDLWGDAVNTASRMESHGTAGRIHVSEEFVNELRTKSEERTIDLDDKILFTLRSSLFTALPRGEIEIKGKGRMRTYFLERM